MEVDTRIRTISVAENTVRNLQEVSDVYRISKTTIIRMAMYHGIKRLENGYRPVRDLNRKKKTKLKIELPIELWDLFEQIVYSIDWECISDEILGKPLKRIPDCELITMFIDMELQPFLSVIYRYNNYKVKLDEDKKEELDDDMYNNKNAERVSTEEVVNSWKYISKKDENDKKKRKRNNENICYVKIDAEICDDLYEKCLETKDNVGLTKNQLWRYLLAQGLSNEYTTRESACILSDYDILNEIDKLNIPRLKAFTLIRYLIENNILIWNR
jgi:hypothetical protein